MKKKIAGFALILLLLGLDQWTKHLAVLYLKDQPSRVLLPKLVNLTYVENTGSAFGLFSGHMQLLSAVTVILSLALLVLYLRMSTERQYRVYRILMPVILAGSLGNIIDRFTRGYVVDFLSFAFFEFPVFNVADCFLTVAAVIYAICYLTHDHELTTIYRLKRAPDETETDAAPPSNGEDGD